MRKNGKRILAMLLAAVMTASLAGCEKGGETAAGTAENDNGEVAQQGLFKDGVQIQ